MFLHPLPVPLKSISSLLTLQKSSPLAESIDPSSSSKKRPSAAKKKDTKKAHPAFPETFSDEDSMRFWGLEHKILFAALSKRPNCARTSDKSGTT
ncbi:hypothetical protein KY290_026128 [Solanum tuberosum]|uniref:Uncharacterized protein n=1 Tax=Solanum tuberosum TaxID=4113 RepID=A0ABQ7UXH3_SOLTU|nr:hypothetical protein KY289_025223 [Solanum tuberosum]KAH0673894.1 hypothetical protein KY284_024981 [Solanum tuberosum]KAH0755858.1 hypothetical protein KY290_026128 [Solanum tuberosum]